MLRQTIYCLIIFSISFAAFSQNIDSTSLQNQLKKGEWRGQVRTFFMATDNSKGLTDFYAAAVGVTLDYKSPKLFKFFKVGLGANFSGKLFSSDLITPDPKTGQISRYELGLFDVQNKTTQTDLLHIVKLDVEANIGNKSKIIFGRQTLNTSFFNSQDGRMVPTLGEGLVYNYNSENLNFTGQYIWGVSPRSTTNWMTISKSFGVYSVGRNISGQASKYAGNTKTKGIFLGELNYTINGFDFGFNNTYVENVFNTTQIGLEKETKSNWDFGLQYVHQVKVNNGGNDNLDLAYFQQGKSDVIYGRIGKEYKSFYWYLNVTRITKKGKYLMPREWSKEPFYTFLSRERNEGYGDVWAFSLNTSFQTKKDFISNISAGYYKMPDVKNAPLSQFGIPSYAQLNIDLNYPFTGLFKGLICRFLFVHKYRIGNIYGDASYEMNKVNLSNFNLVFNYEF